MPDLLRDDFTQRLEHCFAAKEAGAHFERALEIASALDSALDVSRVAFDYAQALEEQGDATQALARYRQAYKARHAANRTS